MGGGGGEGWVETGDGDRWVGEEGYMGGVRRSRWVGGWSEKG